LDLPGMCAAHISHFEDDYGDLYKNFAAVEGGAIPDSPADLELLKNPELAREWRGQGRRSCCRADKPEPHPPACKPEFWFVQHNHERFPHLFL
jgi:hypothetical protein